MYRKLAIALSLLMAMSVFAPYTYAAEPDQNIPTENQIGEQIDEETVSDAVVPEDSAIETLSNESNDVSPETESGDDSNTNGSKSIEGGTLKLEFEVTADPEKQPDVTVTVDGDPLTKGEHYEVSCENGTVTVTGIGEYSGTLTGSYRILQPVNTFVVSPRVGSVYMEWENGGIGEPDYYNIYRNGTLINPEPVNDVSYTDKDAAPKTGYTYEVEPVAVDKITGDTVTAARVSKTVNTYPNKPGKIYPKVSKSIPKTIVRWGAAGVSYQVQISKYKSFKKATKKATKARSITFKKLVNGRTYYVRVRAIDKTKEKTVYGNWEVISFKAKSSGWKKVKGLSYYYVNGTLVKNKEKKIGKLKYYFDKKGVWRGGSKYMWKKAKGKKSNTKNLIVVSRGRHTVCVYQKVGKTWIPIKEYLCSNGKKGRRTPAGTFKVIGKKKSFGKSHTCWYATRWHPKYKAYFHSVLYRHGSMKKIKDGRLGKYVSNGCIRLEIANAKWIYKNIRKGTKVYIY